MKYQNGHNLIRLQVNTTKSRLFLSNRELYQNTYVLALIEGLWYLPGEYGVHGAHDDEHNGVEEGDGVGRVHVRVAHQHVVLPRRIVVDRTRRRNDLPHHYYHHLNCQ